MEQPRHVTFLSDFGTESGYSAVCELVISRLAPAAKVLHLSHAIPAGDVPSGAWLLRRLLPWGPAAIHLAVVDPGVGTKRRALCLSCGRGDQLIGPDNGLLMPAGDLLGGVTAAWLLAEKRVAALAGMRGEPSHTFHGRDIFAPTAALLAQGEPPDALGDPLDPSTLVRLNDEGSSTEPGRVRSQVSEVDVFGNVQLAIDWSRALEHLDMRTVTVRTSRGDRRARLAGTYAELEPGQLGILEDSWGCVALVMRRRRTSDELQVALHDRVELISRPRREDTASVPPESRHGSRDAG